MGKHVAGYVAGLLVIAFLVWFCGPYIWQVIDIMGILNR